MTELETMVVGFQKVKHKGWLHMTNDKLLSNIMISPEEHVWNEEISV
jgi:hypothetical protein